MKCIACNSTVSPWEDYCFTCQEAIASVYIADSKYAKFINGIHPDVVPQDFLSVNYEWFNDLT